MRIGVLLACGRTIRSRTWVFGPWRFCRAWSCRVGVTLGSTRCYPEWLASKYGTRSTARAILCDPHGSSGRGGGLCLPYELVGQRLGAFRCNPLRQVHLEKRLIGYITLIGQALQLGKKLSRKP
jgi:hypothetical protein